MLLFYAAARHNLYAKSVDLHLQQMHKLNKDHPELEQLFKKGFHVVRRSEKYWAGLSSDLVIEQALMRSLKTTGGLTRGRGMGEVVVVYASLCRYQFCHARVHGHQVRI